MGQIKQAYEIKSPVSKVYQALTDASVAEQEYYFNPIKELLERQ